jgi:hypothetical protein
MELQIGKSLHFTPELYLAVIIAHINLNDSRMSAKPVYVFSGVSLTAPLVAYTPAHRLTTV